MYHVSNYSQNQTVSYFYYKQKVYFGHVINITCTPDSSQVKKKL